MLGFVHCIVCCVLLWESACLQISSRYESCNTVQRPWKPSSVAASQNSDWVGRQAFKILRIWSGLEDSASRLPTKGASTTMGRWSLPCRPVFHLFERSQWEFLCQKWRCGLWRKMSCRFRPWWPAMSLYIRVFGCLLVFHHWQRVSTWRTWWNTVEPHYSLLFPRPPSQAGCYLPCSTAVDPRLMMLLGIKPTITLGYTGDTVITIQLFMI